MGSELSTEKTQFSATVWYLGVCLLNILFIFVVVIIALCNASEPSRWNEYPANLYLFYIHFITGLQAGVVPAILIWKKMKIQFIKEMIYEVFG